MMTLMFLADDGFFVMMMVFLGLTTVFTKKEKRKRKRYDHIAWRVPRIGPAGPSIRVGTAAGDTDGCHFLLDCALFEIRAA